METLANKFIETAEAGFRMPFTTVTQADISTEYIGLSKEDPEKYDIDSVALESIIMPSNYSHCLIRQNIINIINFKILDGYDIY